MRKSWDMEPLNIYINQLIEYARVFDDLNCQRWHHLKNREDYEYLFDMPSEDLACGEKLYSEGRNCAGSMAGLLFSHDDIETFPTLSSFVNALKNSWAFRIDFFEEILSSAKEHFPKMARRLYSVESMIEVIGNQNNILKAIQVIIMNIEETDIYKRENGITVAPKQEIANIVNAPQFTNNVYASSADATKQVQIPTTTPMHMLLSDPEKVSISILIKYVPLKYIIYLAILTAAIISASYRAGSIHLFNKIITAISSETQDGPSGHSPENQSATSTK